MRENPKPYEVYRHFKGNVYQILTLATDSEDERPVVVYQALYGEYKVYVRPLDSFMSPVDREKYPYVQQQYRFERVQPAGYEVEVASVLDTEQIRPQTPKVVQTQSERAVETQTRTIEPQTRTIEPQNQMTESQPKTVNQTQELELDPVILEYLDADTVDARLNVLTGAHHRITDDMIDIMAACSDIEVEKGPLEERYQSLKNSLLTKQKYEKVRLF